MRKCLFLISCVLAGCQQPFIADVPTPIKKSSVNDSQFYDSAYSRAEFDVSGLLLDPRYMKKRGGALYCAHSTDPSSKQGFEKYAADIERNIDFSAGYGALFKKQQAQFGVGLRGIPGRGITYLPDFDRAIQFEGVKLFERCTVFIGHPKEVIKVKRFMEFAFARNVSADYPSYFVIGKVMSEQQLNPDAPQVTPLKRLKFNEKVLVR